MARTRGKHTILIPEETPDPSIEKAIKDIPPTNEWVGSKDYWRYIFKHETNRDPELHKKFSELHGKIVDMVIAFCKENGLEDVTKFAVGADGLMDSYPFGRWTCGTDSYMRMRKAVCESDGIWVRDEKNFLHEI